jgi:hypothetical protein
MIAPRGILPPVSDHQPLHNAHLNLCVLVLSAPHRLSSCTDQRHELYRRYLRLGRFYSLRHLFCIDNSPFFASSWSFYRRSIRFNKTPAWSQRTWQRHVITGVSRHTFGATLAILLTRAVFYIAPLLPGNSYHGPSGTDDGDLCKCNTVLYNLISACDACQSESWISCVYQLSWIPTD